MTLWYGGRIGFCCKNLKSFGQGYCNPCVSNVLIIKACFWRPNCILVVTLDCCAGVLIFLSPCLPWCHLTAPWRWLVSGEQNSGLLFACHGAARLCHGVECPLFQLSLLAMALDVLLFSFFAHHGAQFLSHGSRCLFFPPCVLCLFQIF